MSTAYWCLFAAMIFPYIFCVLAKSGSGFDNHNPREYLERLKGWRKRAHWVQLNSFEVLPSFAAVVIIAHQYPSFLPILNILTIGFILMRILYAICYIADKSLLRTVCWALSYAFVLAIFFLSTLHYSNPNMLYAHGRNKEFCHDKFSKRDSMPKRGMSKHDEFKKHRDVRHKGKPGNEMPIIQSPQEKK